MRLDAIEKARAERQAARPRIYPDERDGSFTPPSEFQTAWADHLKDALAGTARHLGLPRLPPGIAALKPEWATMVLHGYGLSRGALDARGAAAARRLPGAMDILLPGSNMNCRETRIWLARDVASVTCLDIFDWSKAFDRAAPLASIHYKTELRFAHASIEALPFPDGNFDLVETRAVLEHVANIESAASEMARVLRPGGIALHSIGPLYYAAGGDHCIGAYGPDHVFDHLLLEDAAYQAKLRDEAFFASQPQGASDARFWAINQIFSFLRADEYIAAFQRHLRIETALVTIAPEAIAFLAKHEDARHRLNTAGLTDLDLCGVSIQLAAVKQ
jgi:SAM-dependent methyltransferase